MATLRKIAEPYAYDVELVHAVGTDKEAMPYYHFHNVYELHLSQREGAEMWIGNRCYSLGPNDLILLSSNDQHRIIVHDREKYERFILYFNPLSIQAIDHADAGLLECFGLHGGQRTHCLKLSNEEMASLLQAYTRMKGLLEDKGKYAREIRKTIALAEILIFINELFLSGQRRKNPTELSSAAHKKMTRIIEYLDQQYREDLDAEAVGAHFQINRHAVNELFREHTGLSFHRYLVNTRIIKARELLIQGNLSVTDVCYECGFNDYANFIRTFTQSVGTAPGKFARQHRRGGRFA